MVIIREPNGGEYQSAQVFMGLPSLKCLSQALILKLGLRQSLLQWQIDYVANEKPNSLMSIDREDHNPGYCGAGELEQLSNIISKWILLTRSDKR